MILWEHESEHSVCFLEMSKDGVNATVQECSVGLPNQEAQLPLNSPVYQLLQEHPSTPHFLHAYAVKMNEQHLLNLLRDVEKETPHAINQLWNYFEHSGVSAVT